MDEVDPWRVDNPIDAEFYFPITDPMQWLAWWIKKIRLDQGYGVVRRDYLNTFQRAFSYPVEYGILIDTGNLAPDNKRQPLSLPIHCKCKETWKTLSSIYKHSWVILGKRFGNFQDTTAQIAIAAVIIRLKPFGAWEILKLKAWINVNFIN